MRCVALGVARDHPESGRHIVELFVSEFVRFPVDRQAAVRRHKLKSPVRFLIVESRLPIQGHVVLHFRRS